MLSPPPSHDFSPDEESSQADRTPRERAVDAAFAVFRSSLNSSRNRLTQARLRVARWLLEEENTFTEDEVNAWLADRGLPIGRRSVENTLGLLVESGLIMRLRLNEDKVVYVPLVPRARPEESLLILCVRCAHVKEVPIDELPELRAALLRRADFEGAFAIHVIRAICKNCRPRADAPA